MKLFLVATKAVCLLDQFIETLREIQLPLHRPTFLQKIERRHGPLLFANYRVNLDT